ncbi:PH domain-containing protein [Aeromicrobium sp. CnD17-E]|uniref:PH domain-containing protein n=1 Tax=Aeromicrobium sp. CnD17-E TaxID=2954487 RepID=UPI002097735E|nr:PH domain-containing protein [Aeromicrobium sp. CnD17-E]MCO7240399.1 PH domain-containing protein [Aeromicrobium sp. CnD17-E]
MAGVEGDADISAAVRRNRAVLTLGTVGLAGLAGALLLDPEALDGAAALGRAGLLLLVVAGALLTVDAWLPFPRPPVRVDQDRTRYVASWVPGVVLVLGALGLGLVVLSFVLGDGLLDASRSRTGGVLLLPAAAATPILLAWSIVLAARPDRLDLTPSGMAVRRVGRTTSAAWHDVAEVEPVHGDPGLSVRVRRRAGRALVVPTRHLALTPQEAQALLVRRRDEAVGRPGPGHPLAPRPHPFPEDA